MFLSDSHSDGTHSLQSNFIFNFSKTSENLKCRIISLLYIYIKKKVLEKQKGDNNLYMVSKLKTALTFIVVVIV